MIDLHAHILPGLDDGPATLDTAVAMARLAQADGITKIVAGPHAFNGIYKNNAGPVRAKVVKLQAELDRQAIPVQILPGMEVHLHLDIVPQYKLGNVLTINDSRYILIELPDQQIPLFADKVLFDLMMTGLVPVFMHPERNREIQRDPEVLGRYVESGMLAVLAVNSVNGTAGKQVLETAKTLLRNHLVHAIASDAHSLRSRPPVLSEGHTIASKMVTGSLQSDGRHSAIAERIITNSPVRSYESLQY